MPQFSITLKAGVPKRQTFGRAQFLTLADIGVASGVDVDVEIAGMAQERLQGLRRADRIQAPPFEAATFTAAVDCTISVIASLVDVRLINGNGQTVDATIVNSPTVHTFRGEDAGTPLYVQPDRGADALTPVYVTGILSEDAPAANITDNAAVAAGPVAAALLAADATRLEFVAYNIGPDPVAIGMAGITWAKRAIVLNAGDTWIERRGAAKAWEVITDAAKAGSVTVQERKS